MEIVEIAMTAPLFSIISGTYNCREKLSPTLESVLSQSLGDFEYLFMDGNSQDGTREWLEALTDPRVQCYSEPDKSLYDAMNKGVARARGRYLIFLGAGDRLLPGVLQEIRQYLPDDERSIVYGDVIWWGQYIYGGRFSKGRLCYQNICHQAIFYGRDVFKIVGLMDLQYKYLSDYAYNIKCFGNPKIITKYVPITISFYEEGGLSGRHQDTVFAADKRRLSIAHLGWAPYLGGLLRLIWLWFKRIAKFILSPVLPKKVHSRSSRSA